MRQREAAIETATRSGKKQKRQNATDSPQRLVIDRSGRGAEGCEWVSVAPNRIKTLKEGIRTTGKAKEKKAGLLVWFQCRQGAAARSS